MDIEGQRRWLLHMQVKNYYFNHSLFFLNLKLYRHLLKVDLEEEQINLLIHVIHIGR